MATRRKAAAVERPYKLGAILGEHEPILRFGDYFKPSAKLPTPPVEFGHEKLVSDWGMLGNDTVGDCAVAGPYHAEMLWCAEGKRAFAVDTDRALETYRDITGWNPEDPATDKGCDPHDVAVYWQNHGLPDADGNPHRIAAFIDLTPGNLTELWLATWLFDAVGVCIEMPSQWYDAFESGEPFDELEHPDIEGGHYVVGACRRNGNLGVVTWGKLHPMTPAAYRQFNVRTLAYLSPEMFEKRKLVDLDGFKLDELRSDMRALEQLAA